MARNVQVQVLRGVAANLPTLAAGEFYYATDTGQLFVGPIPTLINTAGPLNTTSMQVDEYGNVVAVANDTLPWQQSMLDELRAVRLGIQILCEYLNPASGVPSPINTANPVRVPVIIHQDSSEASLIDLAQSIRDGGEDTLQ